MVTNDTSPISSSSLSRGRLRAAEGLVKHQPLDSIRRLWGGISAISVTRSLSFFHFSLNSARSFFSWEVVVVVNACDACGCHPGWVMKHYEPLTILGIFEDCIFLSLNDVRSQSSFWCSPTRLWWGQEQMRILKSRYRSKFHDVSSKTQFGCFRGNKKHVSQGWISA